MAKAKKKKSDSSGLLSNFGVMASVIGIGIAVGGVYLANLYNERQERNEKLRQFCAGALAGVAQCQSEYAALTSQKEWAEIKPLADREKWSQAIAEGGARISEARKSVCEEGAKDLDACQEVADTVKEVMAGLSEHMEDIQVASIDRTGIKERLHKDLSESRTLLRRAEELLGNPKSLREGGDRTLLASIKQELSGAKEGNALTFSELYLSSRIAEKSAERLRWLVQRLIGEKAVQADEWVVHVLDSRPAYLATLVRYTWDNSKDSPPVSSTESTVEVSRDVLDTIRSSTGATIAETRSSGAILQSRVNEEVATALGLPALAQAPYPYYDSHGEIYLEECSEALKVTFQFRFKGRTVERAATIYKEDLGVLYPLTAAQTFVLKEKNASTDQLKIPVWLAQTWSQVYNQRTPQQGGI
ncbi:hypothetical protein M1B72_06955 [Geomonas paludis]|uniref:Uncharacterized protein n=1 Tax=Geomonas paludis TaxID=2740185 RepID=A0ABY4LHX1_9BACT|nr:hypothetical protein [Geomonas paludis]UPU37439.1 hypothetical protein M1B72_06955 [Geomonas paludis]